MLASHRWPVKATQLDLHWWPIRVDSHSKWSMINPLIPSDSLSLEPKPKSSVNKNIKGAWQGEKMVIIHNIWGLILSLQRSGAAVTADCRQYKSPTCRQNAGSDINNNDKVTCNWFFLKWVNLLFQTKNKLY